MKRDQFLLPYSQRDCPEGMVSEVWQAFAAAADSKDRQDWLLKWHAFLAIKAKYYDKDGNRLAGPKPMITFEINGQTFQDGDTFRIQTPELGWIEAAATRQEYGAGKVTGICFGWIQTPLPCTYNKEGNAKLSFYTNNEGHNSLQLAYFCYCPYNVHNHCLSWHNLSIEGNVITSATLGGHYEQPHNHSVVKGFEHLKPKPIQQVHAVGKHGQFQLF